MIFALAILKLKARGQKVRRLIHGFFSNYAIKYFYLSADWAYCINELYELNWINSTRLSAPHDLRDVGAIYPILSAPRTQIKTFNIAEEYEKVYYFVLYSLF